MHTTSFVKHTVIASPSIFANGVDHFRSVLGDGVANDEDERGEHCAERLANSPVRNWLHRAALWSKLTEFGLMS
jgi:hypothetical protein